MSSQHLYQVTHNHMHSSSRGSHTYLLPSANSYAHSTHNLMKVHTCMHTYKLYFLRTYTLKGRGRGWREWKFTIVNSSAYQRVVLDVWSSVGNLCFISQVRAGLRCRCPHSDVRTVVLKSYSSKIPGSGFSSMNCGGSCSLPYIH